jgi:hypothetical protein
MEKKRRGNPAFQKGKPNPYRQAKQSKELSNQANNDNSNSGVKNGEQPIG